MRELELERYKELALDNKKCIREMKDILKQLAEKELIKVFIELMCENIEKGELNEDDLEFFRIITIHFLYMQNEYKKIRAFYILNYLVNYLINYKLVDYRDLKTLFL